MSRSTIFYLEVVSTPRHVLRIDIPRFDRRTHALQLLALAHWSPAQTVFHAGLLSTAIRPHPVLLVTAAHSAPHRPSGRRASTTVVSNRLDHPLLTIRLWLQPHANLVAVEQGACALLLPPSHYDRPVVLQVPSDRRMTDSGRRNGPPDVNLDLPQLLLLHLLELRALEDEAALAASARPARREGLAYVILLSNRHGTVRLRHGASAAGDGRGDAKAGHARGWHTPGWRRRSVVSFHRRQPLGGAALRTPSRAPFRPSGTPRSRPRGWTSSSRWSASTHAISHAPGSGLTVAGRGAQAGTSRQRRTRAGGPPTHVDYCQQQRQKQQPTTQHNSKVFFTSADYEERRTNAFFAQPLPVHNNQPRRKELCTIRTLSI